MKFYKYGQSSLIKLQFTKNTKLNDIPLAAKDILYRFTTQTGSQNEIRNIIIKQNIDNETISFLEKSTGIKYERKDEAFIIRVIDNDIIIYSESLNGTLNGIMTFIRLLDDNSCFNYIYIWDYPYNSFRGVKLFIPARNEINEFKAFIDMMMFFRNNVVMLEIGGAMEYKRHPEINEGWVEYCDFMGEYSGKTHEIQSGRYPWRKNSIHVENGGGSYLTQEEMRDLVKYTNERGISIIPEVPCSSHCDYMLTRHPELAERPEDPYPGTFCISNPASYELLFDILDEVIEVFNPKVINIGHDEFYSINVCDRCRKRLMETYELFAEDVIKIHDYLASKNVRTMLWCDKLMNVLTENGTNHGGALNMVHYKWNVKEKLLGIIHPTWQARELLPKDIICMNWFWAQGKKYDEEIKDFPVVLGNFNGYAIGNYRKRFDSKMAGGVCSNWAATRPTSLQRNRVYFSLAFNENLFWNEEFDDSNTEQFIEVCDNSFESLFNYKNGNPANYGNKYIEVLHTTDRLYKYKTFDDGVFTYGEKYDKDYLLGKYLISYQDGTEFEFPIYLGEHLSFDKLKWYGVEGEQEALADSMINGVVRIDFRMLEASYSTIPVKVDDRVYYKYFIKNPYPEKKIKNVEFILKEDAYWTFDVKKISY